MAKQETIQRWVAEAGIDPERVKLDGDRPVVWTSCWRCQGHGRIQAFAHVANGVCFACGGSKGNWVGLQGLANRARANVRKAERAVTKAAERKTEGVIEARHFLATHAGLAESLRSDRQSNLLRSFARQLIQKGRLSERQVEVAANVAVKIAAAPTAIAVPTGRIQVEGEVVSIKEQFGDYGSTLKMLVVVNTDEGSFKIWGTVPGSIEDPVEIGSKVRFNATLEPSPQDVNFGFFKRPTKAEVI